MSSESWCCGSFAGECIELGGIGEGGEDLDCFAIDVGDVSGFFSLCDVRRALDADQADGPVTRRGGSFASWIQLWASFAALATVSLAM